MSRGWGRSALAEYMELLGPGRERRPGRVPREVLRHPRRAVGLLSRGQSTGGSAAGADPRGAKAQEPGGVAGGRGRLLPFPRPVPMAVPVAVTATTVAPAIAVPVTASPVGPSSLPRGSTAWHLRCRSAVSVGAVPSHAVSPPEAELEIATEESSQEQPPQGEQPNPSKLGPWFNRRSIRGAAARAVEAAVLHVVALIVLASISSAAGACRRSCRSWCSRTTPTIRRPSSRW